MIVKIKHNKAHVLYKALGYDHCFWKLTSSALLPTSVIYQSVIGLWQKTTCDLVIWTSDLSNTFLAIYPHTTFHFQYFFEHLKSLLSALLLSYNIIWHDQTKQVVETQKKTSKKLILDTFYKKSSRKKERWSVNHHLKVVNGTELSEVVAHWSLLLTSTSSTWYTSRTSSKSQVSISKGGGEVELSNPNLKFKLSISGVRVGANHQTQIQKFCCS